jgi:hypothetical protein
MENKGRKSAMKRQELGTKVKWVGIVSLLVFSNLGFAVDESLSEHDKWLQEARTHAETGDKPAAAVAYYRALQQKDADPRTRQEFARLLIEAETDNHESEHSEILQALEAEVK